MSDNARQSLSALMDDEGSEFEVRKLLQQMDSEPEIARTWSRYHAARAAMTGEYRQQAVELSARLRVALEDEPVHATAGAADLPPMKPSASGKRFSGLWRTLGSMAVAASVTAVVILGAQQAGPSGEPVAARQIAASETVVIAATKRSSNLQRAQFGQSALSEQMAVEPDVIRYSKGLDHYIRQHHAMAVEESPHWQAAWVPEGFSPVRHEVKPDSEVMLFSDGRTSFSVCVEPYGERKAAEGAARMGDMVALGKRVDRQFVTVVGHVPLMIADRIASSVSQNTH